MKWKINFLTKAEKQLFKLKKSQIEQIIIYLKQQVSKENPLENAKKLAGKKNLWRYRIGKFRVVFSIMKNEFVIILFTIGNKKKFIRKLIFNKK